MNKEQKVMLDGKRLSTWEDFHEVSAAVFGFPAFYGRNKDAWIDCMSSIDAGMLRAELVTEESYTIVVEHTEEWVAAAPEMMAEFVSLLAAVHERLAGVGSTKQIAVVFR